MTEFITRNYGNKNFEIIIKTDNKEHYKATQDFARRLIDHAKPTIEAKPVVHAHWKPKSYYYICSNCGEDAFWDLDDDLSYLYCPFCGAQMDGKEDE